MLNLNGKVALITGCGCYGPGWGNGKAMSVLFARQGATVLGLDISLAAAQETQALVSGEGNLMHVAACDVTNSGQVKHVFETFVAEHGGLNILVNNVGRSEPGNLVNMDEEIWRSQLDLNLTSAFLVSKYAVPMMAARGGGSIVCISSVAGLRYVGKDQVAYAAAKAALIQFTRASAVMFAPQNVRLNCVVPGLMDTPIVRRLAERYAGGDYEGTVARRNAQVPLGHMGDAWDVAHAALFLASDEARYVTGTEIVVDGGLTASTGRA
ncbi:MAG TPA: SDR family NAD(P)-dependent oxidoreductase [Beijerinckiaceae bacterium]|jgi:NAD(P)-dependent dehydrogenase (short-subunit alcohol dehydrogenase family)|nr:SDR family NAD(P)-dependent oxidoreductase [Beijerinckiaceae bacterium]